MSANKFGQTLIIIGAFIVFVMFFLADWLSTIDFMQNIRYATLICTEKATYPYSGCAKDAFEIKLGQGLIFPLVLISIGLLITRDIISENILCQYLPFIDRNNSDNTKKP